MITEAAGSLGVNSFFLPVKLTGTVEGNNLEELGRDSSTCVLGQVGGCNGHGHKKTTQWSGSWNTLHKVELYQLSLPANHGGASLRIHLLQKPSGREKLCTQPRKTLTSCSLSHEDNGGAPAQTLLRQKKIMKTGRYVKVKSVTVP